MSATFSRTPDDSRYYFLDDAPITGKYTLAFRSTNDTFDTAEEIATELSTLWDADPGVFLFLKTEKQKLDWDQFEVDVRRFLADPTNESLRFLWIENPADPLSAWKRSSIYASPSNDAADTFVTKRITFFDFQNYSLSVAGGSPLMLKADGSGIEIAKSAGSRGVVLSTQFGTHELTHTHDVLTLPLMGEHAGCLQFGLTLKNPLKNLDGTEAVLEEGASSPYDELSHLDIAVRIFFKDPFFALGGPDAFLDSLRYPILGEDEVSARLYAGHVTMYPTLDPVFPMDPDRTYMSFSDPFDASDTPQNPLPSCYRTNLGYTVYLTPESDSKLVFSHCPTTNTTTRNAPFCLVPSGRFEMTVPRHEGNTATNPDYGDNLVCGLSGIEYIKIDPDKKTTLQFVPGKAAFVPWFNPKEFEADSEEEVFNPGDKLINDVALTAWAYITQEGSTPTYFAQPDQAILYEAVVLDDTAGDDFLRFLEVPSTGLPAPGLDDNYAIPLLPYGGIDASKVDAYRSLEELAICPIRRKEIYQIEQEFAASTGSLPALPPVPLASSDDAAAEAVPSGDTSATTTAGTTPQGFVATFSPDFTEWNKLLMAKGTDQSEVFMRDIPRESPLRTSLQTNQLFMVISDPTELNKIVATDAESGEGIQMFPQGADIIAIAGDTPEKAWKFDLNPEDWNAYGTLLVFKFHNKPLIDLARNPKAWSLPEVYNENEDRARRSLLKLLNEAIENDQDGVDERIREKYRNLSFAAQAPGWSGILILNARIDSLPDTIEGLRCGIDESKFFAQYIGIESTKVYPGTGDQCANGLCVEPSSVVGLVDYKNTGAFPADDDSGYNFKVSSLTAIFKNSQLVEFTSEVSVTVNKLFDERSELLSNQVNERVGSPPGGNVVLLKGAAEEHDGEITYSFSFSGQNRFLLPDSGFIEHVDILKAQFTTDPESGDGSVNARFTFWGALNFRHIPEFDVLSFGYEPLIAGQAEREEDDTKTLRFSNLLVLMTCVNRSDTDIPDMHTTFRFEPREITFDFQRSFPRVNSLYTKFPIKFTGFTYIPGPGNAGDNTSKPANPLNYMPVRTPLGEATLPAEGPWYAFTYDLDLGSAGSLAKGSGIVAGIIAAWKPDSSASDLAVGLKLPGSTGGKREIPLQGVVKLAFKNIQFRADADDAGNVHYLLKLKNIQLKLLVLSFPPSGQADIVLFGNPEGTLEDRSMGWYAAYARES